MSATFKTLTNLAGDVILGLSIVNSKKKITNTHYITNTKNYFFFFCIAVIVTWTNCGKEIGKIAMPWAKMHTRKKRSTSIQFLSLRSPLVAVEVFINFFPVAVSHRIWIRLNARASKFTTSEKVTAMGSFELCVGSFKLRSLRIVYALIWAQLEV